jgi:hypothetical protein
MELNIWKMMNYRTIFQKIVLKEHIKSASTFTKIFDDVENKVQLKTENAQSAITEDNHLYGPEGIECFCEKFLPIICLWFG